jgi:hypothetical protein
MIHFIMCDQHSLSFFDFTSNECSRLRASIAI